MAAVSQAPNGVCYATLGETAVAAADLERIVAAVPRPIAAALDRKAYYFVPLTVGQGEETLIADRYDVKQYRELYASAAAVQAAKEGKPLPSGTVLTLIQYKAQLDAQGVPLKDGRGRFLKGDLVAYAVMEKRSGWGSEYPEDLRNGEWEYAVFGADGKFNNKANCKACFQCHKPHDRIDYVISYPAMAGRTMVASAAGRLQLQLRAAPQHEWHGAGLEVTAAIPLTLPSGERAG